MDQRWYVAVLVVRADVEATIADEPLIDHQVRLIRATDPEAAYQRALFLGRSEEQSYKNPDGDTVRWTFAGLHDLAELDAAEPTDGVEIYSWRLRNGELFPTLPKEKLTLFWRPTELDRPAGEWLD